MFSPDNSIEKRIFVVGCSRSGTTLLQKYLASHPRIYTFPETQFFRRLFKSRVTIPWWARFGLTKGKEYEKIEALLNKVGRSDLLTSYPQNSFLLKNSVNNFVGLLDRLTLDNEKNIWVEKSPVHFRYTRFLLTNIPESHVIHIVRDGCDVVASIYDRALKFPEQFKRQQSIVPNVELWNAAIKAAFDDIDNSNASIVVYEDLVADTEKVLRRIFEEMALDFQPEMLRASDTYFIDKSEHWKEKTKSAETNIESKFARLFDAGAQSDIKNMLHLDVYNKIRNMLEGT
jgi:hypothetical protein